MSRASENISEMQQDNNDQNDPQSFDDQSRESGVAPFDDEVVAPRPQRQLTGNVKRKYEEIEQGMKRLHVLSSQFQREGSPTGVLDLLTSSEMAHVLEALNKLPLEGDIEETELPEPQTKIIDLVRDTLLKNELANGPQSGNGGGQSGGAGKGGGKKGTGKKKSEVDVVATEKFLVKLCDGVERTRKQQASEGFVNDDAPQWPEKIEQIEKHDVERMIENLVLSTQSLAAKQTQVLRTYIWQGLQTMHLCRAVGKPTVVSVVKQLFACEWDTLRRNCLVLTRLALDFPGIADAQANMTVLVENAKALTDYMEEMRDGYSKEIFDRATKLLGMPSTALNVWMTDSMKQKLKASIVTRQVKRKKVSDNAAEANNQQQVEDILQLIEQLQEKYQPEKIYSMPEVPKHPIGGKSVVEVPDDDDDDDDLDIDDKIPPTRRNDDDDDDDDYDATDKDISDVSSDADTEGNAATSHMSQQQRKAFQEALDEMEDSVSSSTSSTSKKTSSSTSSTSTTTKKKTLTKKRGSQQSTLTFPSAPKTTPHRSAGKGFGAIALSTRTRSSATKK